MGKEYTFLCQILAAIQAVGQLRGFRGATRSQSLAGGDVAAGALELLINFLR